MPLCDYESILVFYEKQPTYNPQMKDGKPYKIKKGSLSSNYAKSDKIVVTENKGERYPTRIINFKNDTSKLHPTQKPLSLIEYMIKTYTNEGDLILDNTCGSGTTGRGAKNLNRDYIMMEQDETYYEIACKRLED